MTLEQLQKVVENSDKDQICDLIEDCFAVGDYLAAQYLFQWYKQLD
jgi:hypothetical protein